MKMNQGANDKFSGSSTHRIVDGKKHRLCRGPAHEEPVWLPLTEKYFYLREAGNPSAGLKSPCRLCNLYRHSGMKSGGLGEHGFVPAHEIQPFFIEGINRVGLQEFSRRVGMHYENVGLIVKGKRKFIRKMNAKKAMLEIVSIRREGEIRHKKSILRGSAIRGETERVVKSRTDLYKPNGDSELERGRRRRGS